MTTGTDAIHVQAVPFGRFLMGQGHCVGNLVFLSGQAAINEQGQ